MRRIGANRGGLTLMQGGVATPRTSARARPLAATRARTPVLTRASTFLVILAGAALAWSYPALEHSAARGHWFGADAPKGTPIVTAMPICGWGARINCVVDGDTIWLHGEKIRLKGIDAPEVKGKCAYERGLAARATRRLSTLLAGAQIIIARDGHDRFGRTLATVRTQDGDAGDRLVSEGLARTWTGRRLPWCGA